MITTRNLLPVAISMKELGYNQHEKASRPQSANFAKPPHVEVDLVHDNQSVKPAAAHRCRQVLARGEVAMYVRGHGRLDRVGVG